MPDAACPFVIYDKGRGPRLSKGCNFHLIEIYDVLPAAYGQKSGCRAVEGERSRLGDDSLGTARADRHIAPAGDRPSVGHLQIRERNTDRDRAIFLFRRLKSDAAALELPADIEAGGAVGEPRQTKRSLRCSLDMESSAPERLLPVQRRRDDRRSNTPFQGRRIATDDVAAFPVGDGIGASV